MRSSRSLIVLIPLSMLLQAEPTGAVDSVVVVGARFLPGETNVSIGIRISNTSTLGGISLPLEIREITPGAFISSVNMAYSERLANPSVLPDGILTTQYENPDGLACPYATPSFLDGATHPVGASPEAVHFRRYFTNPSNVLDPGSDASGSMLLGFNLTNVPGQFEIDTTCVDPYLLNNQYGLFNLPLFEIPSVFKKGIVNINGPPVARDTAISVNVGGTYIGTLPSSDINGDALVFSIIVAPSIGSVTSSPSGQFTYTAPITEGNTSFQYAVTDGLAGDSGVVSVDVTRTPPDTVHVTTLGNDITGDGTRENPYATIQFAMIAAGTGNVVLAGPGDYFGTIDFPNAKSLKLLSEAGPFLTTIHGTGSESVVVMDIGSAAEILTIDGFTIRDNQLIDDGCSYCAGGISVASPTSGNILNCVIFGNTGWHRVGGIDYDGSGGTIANNWIVGNFGGGNPTDVGGMMIDAGSDAIVAGNTIVGNVGPSAAGVAGVMLENATAIDRFDNNIIAYNAPGDGLTAQASISSTLRNNLYFGNDGDPTGISSRSSWLYTDPVFADSASLDFHLTCVSPARNTGLVSSVPPGVTRDIDRQLRTTSGPKIDIGADQFYDADKQAGFTPSTRDGCFPLTVTFSNESLCIDEQWRWDFGDGQTSTAKNPTHQFTSAGEFQVRLIALGQLDADTTYDTIHTVAPISADFSSDIQSGCVPFTVSFTATANADVDVYTWDFGDNQTGSGQEVSHTYTTTGPRTVRLHSTNDCGSFTTTKPDYITAQTLPVVQMLSSFDTLTGPKCNPLLVEFRYTSDWPVTAWNWDFGDNHTSSDSMPTHVFADGDTFSVRLIATGACGNGQVVRSNYIKLIPRPTITASANPTFACISGTIVNFAGTVLGSYSSASWVFGDGGAAQGLTASHVYTQLGRYLPKFVVLTACGRDTIPIADSITVGSMPAAAFSVNADSGYEPLSVQFTDETSNLPTTWQWRFGDNGTSAAQNPIHAYASGVHAASLIATNPCEADTSADRRIVVGTFRPVIVDSIGSLTDTIVYSLRVDTLVIPYDHTVHLSARLTPLPLRGTMYFTFTQPSGMPPFGGEMKAVPSLDLASGDYFIELRAADSLRMNQQGSPLTKIAAWPYNHVGLTSVRVFPSPVVMDSTIVSFLTTQTATIKNTSSGDQEFSLIVEPAQVSGPPFEIVPGQGSGAILEPGDSLEWTLGFRPFRKGDFTGWLRVRSNDPGNPDFQVPLAGRGIGEQVPPRVATATPASNSEARIDESVTLSFSEQLIVAPLDTIVMVRSKRANTDVVGTAQMGPTALLFTPTEWFWPDDTVTVTVRSIVTDTNGNRLDGNSDGVEGGSPDDDYHLTFATGPGVYPGDANRDGRVNEADVLPLGRFWRMQGPPREGPSEGLTMQPSRSFPIRDAAHADCDGNGRVDSADICPIAEFFDQDTILLKTTVRETLEEAESWPGNIIDAMLGALDNCLAQGVGTSALRELLTEMKGNAPVPYHYSLEQNYPNPFNSETVISFLLARPGHVTLEVFDILGQRVARLADDDLEAGRQRAIWNGKDDLGRERASGIYFYRLRTGGFTQTRKMLLLK